MYSGIIYLILPHVSMSYNEGLILLRMSSYIPSILDFTVQVLPKGPLGFLNLVKK